MVLTTVMLGTVVRLGLLTSIVSFFFSRLLTSVPLTSSFNAWYGMPGMWAVMFTVGMAMVGFWLSRGTAPLFGRPLLDE